jgi:predicted Fe-S protein YdhL (DUF1289 family)
MENRQSGIVKPARAQSDTPFPRSVPMFSFSWTPTPAKAILTPCIGICALGADGLCDGCFRTGDEIAAWSTLSDAARAQLMEQVLPAREAARP